MLTGAGATQWQCRWKDRIDTGDGLEEDSGHGCHYLLAPDSLSKCDVIRSLPAFPARGQALLQALSVLVREQASARLLLGQSLQVLPGEGAFPRSSPRGQQLWLPDPFLSVPKAPPHNSDPPNSSPGTWRLAPAQEKCLEVARWCYSAPCRLPKEKRHLPQSYSLIQAI